MYQDMSNLAEAESRFRRSIDQYREMMRSATPEDKLALVDQFMGNMQQHLQECQRSMDHAIMNQMQNDDMINQLLKSSFSSDDDEDYEHYEDYEFGDDDYGLLDTDEEDIDVEDYDDSNESSDGYESSVSR